MADNFFDQFDSPAASSAGSNFFDQFDELAPPKQNKSVLGDIGTSLKRGAQQLPGALTGVADIGIGAITGERYASQTADVIGEATGFQPGKWAEEARQEYSPQYQTGAAEIDKAWEDGSASEIAGAYLRNPRNVAGVIAESAPSMAAGGLAGRGALMAGRAAGLVSAPVTAAQAARQAVVAGATGEGAIAGGQTMAQIDESVDARRAAAAAAGAGALTAGLGYAGGRLAQHWGLADPQTLIAGGPGATAGRGGVAGSAQRMADAAQRMAGGAVAEGLLQEAPQSAGEQIAQNWAEQQPLGEGVARNVVEGAIAGGAMGAGANVMPGRARPEGDGAARPEAPDAAEPPAPEGTPAPFINDQALAAAGIYPPAPAPVIDERRMAAALDLGIDPTAGPLSKAATEALGQQTARQETTAPAQPEAPAAQPLTSAADAAAGRQDVAVENPPVSAAEPAESPAVAGTAGGGLQQDQQAAPEVRILSTTPHRGIAMARVAQARRQNPASNVDMVEQGDGWAVVERLPAEPIQRSGAPNGAIPDVSTDAAVATPSGAQGRADVARGAGAAVSQPDVSALGGVEPVAAGTVAGRQPAVSAGNAGGGRAAVDPASPGGRALSMLIERTGGLGTPDALAGPENQAARAEIVSMLRGVPAEQLSFGEKSVGGLQAVLHRALGLDGPMRERQARLVEMVDELTGQAAPAAVPEFSPGWDDVASDGARAGNAAGAYASEPSGIRTQMGADPEVSLANPESDGTPNVPRSSAAGVQRDGITAARLSQVFAERFPKLAPAFRTMVERGVRREKGGVVMVNDATPQGMAQTFARSTGRRVDDVVQYFRSEETGEVQGFYDARSGLTFLVAPNLNEQTAPAVLLHEMIHSQQRANLDARAIAMLNGRASASPKERAFLDRVARRMADAGETGNPREATAYIVEQAVLEGRDAGYTAADGKLADWIEANIGKPVANLVRGFMMMVRGWIVRSGLPANTPVTVDDLVSYAMAGMERAARGDVRTSRGGQEQSPATMNGESASSAQHPNARSDGGSEQIVGAQPERGNAERRRADASGARASINQSISGDPLAHAAMPRQASTFDEARAAAKAFQGQPLTNGATGMVVTVSRNNLDKMLSQSAVGKSTSAFDQSLAVANLDHLFSNAVFGWTKPDRDSDPNIVGVHRFFAPMDTSDGTRVVKLTVKESARQDQGSKIYTVESLEIESPASIWVDSTVQADGLDPTSTPYAGLIQSLVEAVQQRNARPDGRPQSSRAVAGSALADNIAALEIESGPEVSGLKDLGSTQDPLPTPSEPHVFTVGQLASAVNGLDLGKRAEGDAPQFSRAAAASAAPTAPAFPDLTPAQQAFLSKIGTPPATQRARDWIREKTDRAMTKIRQGLVDRYAALKELDEKAHGTDFLDTAITDSSWVLARMSSSAAGAMNAMLNTGRLKLNGFQKILSLQEDDTSGGLAKVLAGIGPAAEVERFMGWIAANRAEKLMAEGRENLFSADEIAAGKQLNAGRMEDGRYRAAEYARAFIEFQKYRDDVLAIAEATGVVSAETRAMWRDEFYVPFYRVMEEEGAAQGPRASKGLTRQEAYKKLKGGRENLNDLLENTLMNFHHLLSASLKNQAATQAIRNAEKMGIAKPVAEAIRDPKTSTFILEGGQRRFYQVDDPLVYEALTSLADPGLNNFAVRTMAAFKRVFTNTTTITPQFIAANLLRDAMSAVATSPVSANFAGNIFQGARDYRNERTRAQMLASGGAFSFGHIYGADAAEVKASLNRTLKGAQLVEGTAMVPGLLKKGWKAWNEFADTAENANRAAIFSQNQDRGALRAAFEARDLMDFNQQGAWPAVRFLIRVVPFLNARLQGLDKLYRAGVKPAVLTAMGKGTASDKQAAMRFAAVTGALTLASIALYLANADDDEYKKLEEWQKDSYWFFRIGDNAFFLPKPFEVGAIATMAERITQQYVDDKATGRLFGERLREMLTQTFAFSPVPQLFQPALDIYANKDAFTGRDIETAGMERLSKGLRERDTTTVVARGLSAVSRAASSVFGEDAPALSPVQADHLIRGYLGQVGVWGAGMVDTVWRAAAGEESPDTRWSEYQPVRRFYRDLSAPAPYTRYSTLFYDGLREAARVQADVNRLRELGRSDEARELATEKGNILALRRSLNRAQQQVNGYNDRMEAVRRSGADGEMKRRELDRLMTLRNAVMERHGMRVEDARAAG